MERCDDTNEKQHYEDVIRRGTKKDAMQDRVPQRTTHAKTAEI